MSEGSHLNPPKYELLSVKKGSLRAYDGKRFVPLAKDTDNVFAFIGNLHHPQAIAAAKQFLHPSKQGYLDHVNAMLRDHFQLTHNPGSHQLTSLFMMIRNNEDNGWDHLHCPIDPSSGNVLGAQFCLNALKKRQENNVDLVDKEIKQLLDDNSIELKLDLDTMAALMKCVMSRRPSWTPLKLV